jgi:hypothetical protein
MKDKIWRDRIMTFAFIPCVVIVIVSTILIATTAIMHDGDCRDTCPDGYTLVGVEYPENSIAECRCENWINKDRQIIQTECMDTSVLDEFFGWIVLIASLIISLGTFHVYMQMFQV